MTDQEDQSEQEHYRMWLNNFVNKRKLGVLTYRDEENRQQQTWASTVQLNGTDIGNGQARNKNGSRENAAREGLAFLESKHSN